MSKETSVKISYGMFISCIVIVLHHSVGDVFYDAEGTKRGYPAYNFNQNEVTCNSLFRLEYYLDVICCNVSFNSFKYFQ